MKNAVILHGKPTKERYENPLEPKPHEANWLPWLGRQLSSHNIDTVIPALPLPYFPVYRDWEAVFPKEHVNQETGLIGHSAGAEFLLRWLSENNKTSVDQLVLVAPYRDYAGKYGEFSKYQVDTSIIERVGRLTILNSLDDDAPILRRTQELMETFPSADLVEVNGFGHFRIGHNMTSEELPQLLDILGV